MDGYELMGRCIIFFIKFPLYFVGIYVDHIYVTTYVYSQNLSAKFLWISKIDVK